MWIYMKRKKRMGIGLWKLESGNILINRCLFIITHFVGQISVLDLGMKSRSKLNTEKLKQQ